jgi:hypothetical protein
MLSLVLVDKVSTSYIYMAFANNTSMSTTYEIPSRAHMTEEGGIQYSKSKSSNVL